MTHANVKHNTYAYCLLHLHFNHTTVK